MAAADETKRKAQSQDSTEEPPSKKAACEAVKEHSEQTEAVPVEATADTSPDKTQDAKADNEADGVKVENGNEKEQGGDAVDKNEEADVAKVDKEKDPCTVWVGNLSHSLEEDQLELDFEEHGEIRRINFVYSKGYALITYTTEEAAQAALKMDGNEYWGRDLKINLASKESVGHEVFVQGLPASATEQTVRAHFAKCGTILKLKISTTDEGECKGNAWITFENEEGLDSAIGLHGCEFGGSKNIKVEVARKEKGKGKGKDGKGKGKGKSKGGKGKKGGKGGKSR